MLRSAFTEAWTQPGAPVPLPMPLQSMLVADARARIERSGHKDYLTYYVGQIVGDMREETSVRSVIQDMLVELAETWERFDGQLGGKA
jgi:NAD(P)H-dependent flavin oxidoreductase YrpB (nitropropane dioxygenase family)